MKKIVILNGSPRENGCTSTLAERAARSAQFSGAEVTSYFINTLDIRGCQGCFNCKPEGKCVLQDDMQAIYKAISSADALVLASPVYMWSMSAQLKTAVDRLFAFFQPGRESILKPGIKVLLLFTQGQKDTSMFRNYFEHVGNNMQYMSFGEYKILVAGGTHLPEHVLRQKDVLEEADAMGKWLAE